MLINDFYKILEFRVNEPGKAIFRVELNENHPIFGGHFPGNPIVPGVCQVQMVKELLSELEKRPFRLAKADSIKHIGIIMPLENKILEFEIDYKSDADESLSCSCIITAGERVFLKFKGIFV